MKAEIFKYAAEKLLTLDIPAIEAQMMTATIQTLNQEAREARELEEQAKIDKAFAARQAELELETEGFND